MSEKNESDGAEETTPFNVRLRLSVLGKLRRLARLHDLTPSDLVRRAVKEFLEREETRAATERAARDAEAASVE